MKTLFEILKSFFFLLTILVGVFFLRGHVLLSEQMYNLIKTFIMPGYLVFCGIMIGYLVAHIWIQNNDSTKTYVKSFVIGIVLGIILSISYMFI